MKRFPKFIRPASVYVPVIPPIIPDVVPPVPVVGYVWADVFADHTLAGGLDWTTWGVGALTPAEVPLEWFMRNVVAAEAPDAALITLESPTGSMFLMDRMQVPPRSIARSLTLDLKTTKVERGKNTRNWGQIHLWGELVADAGAPDEGILQTNTASGAMTMVLNNGASSLAFLNAVSVGAVVDIRGNATAPNYHPFESRETVFIAGVNIGTRTLTLFLPLEKAFLAANSTSDYPGEPSDPTTLTLLAGSLLAVNAAAGDTSLTVFDGSHFFAGDWVNISTIEVPAPNKCQFMDAVGGNDFVLDVSEDFGANPIQCNEELHRIVGVAGNVITLALPLGKNKLVSWKASVVKVDPIDGFTLAGGDFNGVGVGSGAAPAEHQYVWARYMINSTVKDGRYDMENARATNVRRMGQAIRFDTGNNNLAWNNTIGKGGGIEAGQAYGISFRLGERNSFVRGNTITQCRHSIEMWSTSGGCIIENNLCSEDTSSSIDTHGAWNTGVIIRNNTVTRSALALYSSDSGGSTDAIRIGNPKFVWDEDIQVLNNIVRDYKGVALTIIPSSRRVTVDGLDIDNVQRAVSITRNSRHDDVWSEDIIIQNLTIDNVSDRVTELSHFLNNKVICKGLTLRNWVIGASGVGVVATGAIGINLRVTDCEDVLVENVTIANSYTKTDDYGFWFENVVGLVLTNNIQVGGQRGISLRNTTLVSGVGNRITGLTAGDPIIVRADGVTSGSLTITHDQGASPSHLDDTMTIALLAA